ncbi:MAG: AAA family ATPase [Acidimicrobiales bacterium]
MADANRAAEPPHDATAEQALIGAALLDAAVYDRVHVNAGDFYRPTHETMWAAIAGLNGAEPDRARGLLDALAAHGDLKAGILDGGYIHTCIDACVTPAAAGQYARVVARCARHRRAQQAVQRAAQRLATTDPDDLTAAIYEAMADLEAVTADAPTALDATTWEPQPLDAVLAGQELDPPPALMPRSDGACLVYAAAVHSLSGEPGSGKTWIALHAAVTELAAGNHVAFVDFEDRASRVIGRLLALGATPDQIRDLFIYIRPHKALDNAGRTHLEHAVSQATLAILDGVTEAMTLHGLDLSANPDIATFYAMLPRWIADHGPAVILIDHVVKDVDRQGRWSIGGQHKLAGLDGVAYIVKSVEPFGRGKRGTARVVIAKDRPGFVEEVALGRTAAEFHLDATNPDILMAVLDPPEAMPTDDHGDMRPTYLMGRVAHFLTLSQGSGRKAIEEAVRGKRAYVKRAIDCLIQEGYIELEDGPRGAKYHHLVHRFDAYDGDQQ